MNTDISYISILWIQERADLEAKLKEGGGDGKKKEMEEKDKKVSRYIYIYYMKGIQNKKYIQI